jgi:citrate lyase subunit beta/citryl-CoA lyase
MAVLRSLLFVPGNQARMLDKATGVFPDALVPDMEDSVPWEEKANAREVTTSFLPRLAQGGRLVIPRINSLDTGLLEADLAISMACRWVRFRPCKRLPISLRSSPG